MPCRHVNLTLAGFFCSAIFLAIALFRFRLISSLPLNEEERNQLLINHSHALLYTISPDGIMTYVSPNWPLVLGHATEEVIGKSFSVFVLPEDHAACYAFLEQVVSGDTLQTGTEYRVIHKNGDLFWHTSSIIPVKDKKGRLLAYVGAAHDITRLKHTQQELTAVNMQLSQLVASREDELRTAIAETLHAAEQEARRIGEDIHDGLCQDLIALARLTENFKINPAHPQCRNCLTSRNTIHEHSIRLARVARDFSHNLALQELDVQTLPEALDMLARRTDQLFQTETELNVPEQLTSLTGRQIPHIYRIIREAVANAVKHARAKHLWIDLVREPQQLVISISNDGLPLPEPKHLADGFGQKQMRMRTRLLDGSWTIQQNEKHHTVVELIIPLKGDST
jgi:PAS domain S-box-containing protein